MSPRPVSAAASLTALAVAASLLLGGCSFLPRVPILNPGGNDSGSSSDDDRSGADEIEENPFLDNTVPANFPSDVPLPDLDIYLGMASTEDSWTIIYYADDLEADFSSIVSLYEGDGWETLMNNQAPDGSLGVFKKDPYQVQVMGLAEGGDDMEGPALTLTLVRSN